MYRLYVECRDRAYMVAIGTDVAQDATGILSVNTNDRDELLRVSHRPTLISQSGYRFDREVTVSAISVSERPAVEPGQGIDHTVDVTITLADREDGAPCHLTDTAGQLYIDDTGDSFILRDAEGNESENWLYRITFVYQGQSGHADIYCASSSTIYDVVIDFGSEASQMLVKRHRDAWGAGAIVPLFGGCLRHFYPTAAAGAVYDQQDRDPRLMRSLFFKHPGAEPPQSASDRQTFLCTAPSDSDPYLQFITRRDADDRGERLPNIKISYLAQINRSGFDLEMLHHALVLRFLHEAVRQVADKERVRCNTRQGVAIRVTLLVPNVMGQEAVSELIADVSRIANSTSFRSQLPEGCPPLLFADVKSCSESDASFLYWMNTTPVKAGKDYLIIDVGKGTTDFSVVHVTDASNAISRYRSGFLGAGNAISYAIFEYLLLQLTDAIDTDDRIAEIRRLLRSESPVLYELEDLIERIKQGEEMTDELASRLRRLAHAEHWPEENVSELLQHFKLEDEERIIAGVIHKIVAGIALRTQGLHYDEMMLSGRGFLYAPLADEVKAIFARHADEGSATGTGYSDVNYRPEYAKTGCLYGAIAPVKISMQNNMTGIPQFSDARTGHEMNEAEVNRMINEQAEESKLLSDTPEDTAKRRHGLFAMARNWWDYMFSDKNLDEEENGDDSTTDDDEVAASPAEPENAPAEPVAVMGDDNIRAIMQSRYRVRLYGANTRVSVGGNQYKIVGGDHLPDGDDCRLYFDGAHFYVRSKDHSYELVEDVARIPNTNLLFESLFPFSLQILGRDHDIPRNYAVAEF